MGTSTIKDTAPVPEELVFIKLPALSINLNVKPSASNTKYVVAADTPEGNEPPENWSAAPSVNKTVEVTTVGEALVNETVPPKELSSTPRVLTPLFASQ